MCVCVCLYVILYMYTIFSEIVLIYSWMYASLLDKPISNIPPRHTLPASSRGRLASGNLV